MNKITLAFIMTTMVFCFSVKSENQNSSLATCLKNFEICVIEPITLSANSLQNKDFSISPNPAKSRLNIILPAGMTNAKVAVFDVLGKMVYNGEISNLSSSINVSTWNSGVYLVKVSASDVTQTKRFIKQ